MEKYTADFHIAEYNALRSELQSHVRSGNEAVFYSLIANSAIVAWVASLDLKAGGGGFIIVASCLPMVLTLLAWGEFWQRRRSIILIAGYCRVLEEKFAHQGMGWQGYVAQAKQDKKLKSQHVAYTVFVLQVVLGIYLILSTIHTYIF